MRYYDQYIEDISQLTGLPKYIVINLMKVFRTVVGHEIYECMTDNKDELESRCLGIGKLVIEYDNVSGNYNATIRLSRDMKEVLDKMLDDQKSPLTSALEKSLVDQIISKYKKVIDDGE